MNLFIDETPIVPRRTELLINSSLNKLGHFNFIVSHIFKYKILNRILLKKAMHFLVKTCSEKALRHVRIAYKSTLSVLIIVIL